MTKKQIEALSQEEAQAKVSELLAQIVDDAKAHAEALKAKDDAHANELAEKDQALLVAVQEAKDAAEAAATEDAATYNDTIADMQLTIDKLTKQKDNPNAKAEITHGKKTYVLNAPKFRIGDKVCDVKDLEADPTLVKAVLCYDGQQILTEKED